MIIGFKKLLRPSSFGTGAASYRHHLPGCCHGFCNTRQEVCFREVSA